MLSNKRNSFTLIELLVVLAIITIMAGLLVAMLGPFAHRRELDLAAVKLLGDLRQTHQFARVMRRIDPTDPAAIGYRYHGLRLLGGLGPNGARVGYAIIRFCFTDGTGHCQRDLDLSATPSEVPFDATVACNQPNQISCEIVKSSVELNNPEMLEDTFFGRGVTIVDTAAHQIGIGETIVFTADGSATTDGQTLLTVDPADGMADIVLDLHGRTRTIAIAPLTGHMRIE